MLEDTLLDALRVHADGLTRHAGADGKWWAKVKPADARSDMTLAALRFEETFDSALKRLEIRGSYRRLDDEHGLVDLGALPPESE